jgi:sterol desaturase/sphingolipid hydroxylase (fatty acid hydroxylase superfamily)
MNLHLNAMLPIGLLLAIALWEYYYPCRPTQQSRIFRWSHMIATRLVGKLFFFVVMPLTLAELATWYQNHGLGLFNMFSAPSWLTLILGVLLLDFSGYIVHVIAHNNQIIWRVHRPHHIDTEYDVTTALRAHPFDDFMNTLGEITTILIFGISPDAIITYAVISGIIVKFSHANVLLYEKFDSVLRWFIVTPNMHRIHHSAKRHENDSNYSTHFTFWDRLFGTYRAHPEEPHATMMIGLTQFRDVSQIRLDKFMLRPFHDKE